MNLRHTLIICTGITALAGCSKGFLDRLPTDQVAPQNFFGTENEFIAYTNGFYPQLPDATAIYGESVDNIVKSSVNAEVSGTRIVPTTDSKWSWTDLRAINFLLNNSSAINYKDPAVRDRYFGLAKFFRANFYFEKVKWYGDVPWYGVVIENIDLDNLMKPRDPRTLIMDSIMADLDFAIQHLPATKSVERVTKWTALALKSRIALYEGTWRKYHTEFNLPDAERFLNLAADAALTFINESGYTVYNKTTGPSGKPYQDLFATIKADGVAEEVILARRYSNELALRHNLQFYMTARTQGKPGLEKSLVNSYLMADGSRFTDKPGYESLQFYDEVQNRDPRLAQTIRTPGYTRIGQTTQLAPDFEATMTGYQPIKWMNIVAMDGNSQSYQDMVLFRTGEVLLNYAEAKAELGTIDQGDINISIKKLRDRVGMPNLDVATANANPDPYLENMYKEVSGAQKGLILEIRRERRIELVMENNFRWDDIMRWKEGHLLTKPFLGMYFPGAGLYDLNRDGKMDVEIYDGAKPPATGPYQIASSELTNAGSGYIFTNRNINKTFRGDRDYLWPLPAEDLELNKKLTQNPNW
ncbi:RagB/SusD family nutrient uptake outer membrane protein [Pseudoflavitalea rhizosphaerae]|uniref:RagB/SusD family nutrient uptake outer membrane protein n=1 Tax=Pseudoflavitalea rhizosphaerae TaxID=1884793 RepID=UPI000F8E5346|nr:RagB/SusD family nutrient uptake outer membrane protein [Pseudoflavitalea rhizosphaerae]